MCILFVYANGNPKPGEFKLILASNRDEFYKRSAAPLSRWNVSSVAAFGGLDLEGQKPGGTWLAIGGDQKVIKVGVLLNITETEKKNNVTGRGHIVTDYITKDASNTEYSKKLIEEHHLFNSFNLVSIEIRDKNATILHCTNAPANLQKWPEKEALGFGNSPPSIPFKKVEEGKKMFNDIIKEYKNKNDLTEKCLSLLNNTTKFWPDDELEKRAPNWNKNLSSIMVKMEEHGYGSRTHTVILIDSDNRMDFYEETMFTSDPKDEWKRTHLQHKFV